MEHKRRFRIVAKNWETGDAATFSLEPADGLPFHYLPGQYLSLIFETPGGEKRRAYSFSSCPGVNEIPAITVKRVPNGEISNRLLFHTQPGDLLTTTEPHGRFLLPEDQPDTIFYIAAGSGITPVMSHLKALFYTRPTTRSRQTSGAELIRPTTSSRRTNVPTEAVTQSHRFTMPRIVLYYANHDSRSTIFKPQIDHWIAEFPGHFECLYFFSREKNAAHALYSHLNNALLEQLVNQYFSGNITTTHRQRTLFYLCAPTAMMRMAEMTLRVMDFPEESILKETFVPDTRFPTRKIDQSKMHTIVAAGQGERIEFQTFEGETILNAALRQGIALPYTCKAGVCFTCLAKCVQGEVDVVFADTTNREGPGQMVNTCIGYAVSGQVELWYE